MAVSDYPVGNPPQASGPVAEEELIALYTFEVQVHIVLPGEANAPVHVNGLSANVYTGHRGGSLRHSRRDAKVIGVGLQLHRRMEDGSPHTLHRRRHFGDARLD